ncbi:TRANSMEMBRANE PROTEIN [Salix koriyanagi]|uniref:TRANSMEMBRANE PROTEIN n=1 Tax=Salix koriyanagi TaxID=2511006 RepID=A0A9Q0ZBH9_9ROSI|nr:TRANSMEMBRANE PROTEIN [Salix koriyanagi]
MQRPVRFSSCRGVAFEIKPHENPFSIAAPSKDEPKGSKRIRLPWPSGRFSKVFSSSSINRSASRASSHFCDLDLDGEDDISLEALEEGKDEEKEQELTPFPSASKKEQPSKPARKQESRLSVILLDQANILALTLCRSEAFLRVVFWLAVEVLGRSWIPLPIKTATTSLLQSLGGIHSSCGISSVAWLIYALVLTLKSRENTSSEIIGVASSILSLLCVFLFGCFPSRPPSPSQRLRKVSQVYWMDSSSSPLGLLRRVPVKVSAPSGHASIIRFEGGVKAGILGRISPSPLSEWHAFGIISDGKTEHMMLAGAVGDFTKSLVSNPPSHLWVRQVHFAGLPYLVNMYDRVLLVATGSGICVFLSFLLQPCRANVCVLWVAKGIEQNFGKEIQDMMSGHPEDQVIVHDTAVLGRPNVSQMSVEAAKKWGAEVVVVTSNPEGSRDIVNSCKAAGIAAFGPIWDS